MNMSKDKMLQKNCPERGIALPIVLIFLVVMMLLGVTSLRNVTLGEKMSGNLRNQQLAFQAAEKALRYCENAAPLASLPNGFNRHPGELDPVTKPWENLDNWKDNTLSVALPAAPKNSDGTSSDGLQAPPRCMIEYVPFDWTKMLTTEQQGVCDEQNLNLCTFRITARGVGGTDNAVVILQSYLVF